jgi:hypothetical protein
LVLKTKVRRIGTGYGILIPKKKIKELGISENETIVIRRIEKPVKDIRGILKGGGFSFERTHEEGHDIATFRKSAGKRRRSK